MYIKQFFFTKSRELKIPAPFNPEKVESSKLVVPKVVEMATYKSSTNVFTIPKKMTAKTTPVEVGTRGTIGSLILQEIEYLSKIELGCQESSCKSTKEVSTSNSSSAMPKLGSLPIKPKKKKRAAGIRLIPKMCDMIEIADNIQPKTRHGFTYKNLKAEIVN